MALAASLLHWAATGFMPPSRLLNSGQTKRQKPFRPRLGSGVEPCCWQARCPLPLEKRLLLWQVQRQPILQARLLGAGPVGRGLLRERFMADESGVQSSNRVAELIAAAAAMPGVADLMALYEQQARIVAAASMFIQSAQPQVVVTAGADTSSVAG
jgi:hypothetical protein